MAKRVIKAKYRETKVVNYRHGNTDVKTLLTCTFLDCDEYRTDYNGQTDTSRCKHTVGIQYKHESKEDIAGFIPKPVARPEYGMIYQHKVCYYKIFTADTYTLERIQKLKSPQDFVLLKNTLHLLCLNRFHHQN